MERLGGEKEQLSPLDALRSAIYSDGGMRGLYELFASDKQQARRLLTERYGLLIQAVTEYDPATEAAPDVSQPEQQDMEGAPQTGSLLEQRFAELEGVGYSQDMADALLAAWVVCRVAFPDADPHDVLELSLGPQPLQP